MPSFHQILVELRNALGFQGNNGGLCAGYAESASVAFLIGDYDAFKARCHYIEKKYARWLSWLGSHQQNLSFFSDKKAKRKKLIEVLAFMNQIELYMFPDKYRHLFGGYVNQKDVQAIESINYSHALKAKGGRGLIGRFCGHYTPKKTMDYVAFLKEFAKDAPCNFTMSLSSGNHSISLCYDVSSTTWIVNDANQPDVNALSVDDSFALCIFIAIGFLLVMSISFSTRIYSLCNDAEMMEAHFVNFKNTESFKKISEISLSDLDDISNQAGLISIAAGEGDVEILKKVSSLSEGDDERQRRYFNQATINGATLVFIAAENSHIEVLRFLSELKDSDSNRLVDFNQATIDGMTPAYVAAQDGHVEGLRFFSELKDSDGNLLVDFNQATIDGAAPAHIAAQEAHIEVLRFLSELKDSDSNQLVDFNQATNKGATPALIAAQKDHVKVLRFFSELKDLDGNLLVDFNQATNQGVTPAFIAAQEAHIEALRFLSELKDSVGRLLVDFSKARTDGTTPAYIAAKQGHVKVLHLLAELKDSAGKPLVNFNQANARGVTLLICAVSFGHYECVKLLLELGVESSPRFQNQTALEIAQHRNHQLIVDLLSAHEASLRQTPSLCSLM